MKRIALCAALLAWPVYAAELTPEQMHLLTRDLNDPESARVRNVIAPFPEDNYVICGEVNWRGTQGGYIGYKKFWMVADEQKVAIDPHVGYDLFAEALGCSS